MRFFDFFAGIGGFRLGMEMAGHECVGHCEIDKYANKSYTAMHHPKESEVFFKAEVNSDSQLYKQAGNSVTVNVIYEIAKRFPKRSTQNQLFGNNAHTVQDGSSLMEDRSTINHNAGTTLIPNLQD